METRPKPLIKADAATISAGDTEVTVTHNKGVTNKPTATPTEDIGGRRYWIEYVDVNSFKIVIDSADPFTDFSFNYNC